MSEQLAKLQRLSKPEPEEQHEQSRKEYIDSLPNDAEKRAYKQLLREAAKHGATLAGDGRGGLPPSLVLGVFRRDADEDGAFACKSCGTHGDPENGLSLHHKGGDARSEWLSKMGHKNIPANLSVLCEHCHDRVHSEAREDGTDSSQVTPEGDVGTKRDHGKPVADPET